MKVTIIKNLLDDPTEDEDITKYIGETFEVVGEHVDGVFIMLDDDDDDFKLIKGEYKIIEE